MSNEIVKPGKIATYLEAGGQEKHKLRRFPQHILRCFDKILQMLLHKVLTEQNKLAKTEEYKLHLLTCTEAGAARGKSGRRE
jgi:hypothetical protein